jgi:hypothetical protein
MVLPGQKLMLGVMLVPVGGNGSRRTVLELVTSTNDTIRLGIRSEAGVRELTVTPLSLFESVAIGVGQEHREVVAISNTGSFAVQLAVPVITGIDVVNYRLGSLPRLRLEPGQTEYLEVTYAPQGSGPSSAQLEIASNASNGTQIVMLGGTAARIKQPESGGEQSVIVSPGEQLGGVITGGVSSVSREEAIAGVVVSAVRPNPAREAVELRYRVAASQQVTLGLYDISGRLVRELEGGTVTAGEHTVKLTVDALEVGQYFLRLRTASGTVTRSFVVMK